MNKTQKEILASSEEDIMTPEEWEFATDKFKDMKSDFIRWIAGLSENNRPRLANNITKGE